MNARIIVISLVFIATALLFTSLGLNTAPSIRPLTQLPQEFGEWRMVNQQAFSPEIIAVLRPTDYLSRAYADGRGNVVQLYIGFHDGSERSGPIHSPKNCLPGGGWNNIAEKKLLIHTGGSDLHLVHGLFQKGSEKALYIYWFQLREKSVTEEYQLKFFQLYNSIVNKRRDATFVRVSVPVAADEKAASAIAVKFVTDFYPFFSAAMPL
jgi:EpsI family protein